MWRQRLSPRNPFARNMLHGKEKEMAQTLDTPKFQNPGEEALWWEKNQATVENLFTEPAANGTLRQGTLAARGKTPTTTIRLAPEDIELAKRQAAERGLRYQTYLKMLLHQALDSEEHSAGRP